MMIMKKELHGFHFYMYAGGFLFLLVIMGLRLAALWDATALLLLKGILAVGAS